MEVHIWGPFGGALPSFDAQCLAVIEYVRLTGTPARVVASNNVHMSPTKTLPVLVETDTSTAVSGFTAITSHLANRGYRIPTSVEVTETSESPEGIDIALQAYLESLETITLWTLFVQKQNYETVTRPLISDSIPFPMQYNVAIWLQRKAARRCEFEGITNKKTIRAIEVPKERTISKLHEDIVDSTRQRQKALKGAQQTMQVATLGSRLFENIAKVLPRSKEVVTPSILLLQAHLVLQSVPTLPEKPLASVIAAHENIQAVLDTAMARAESEKVDKDTVSYENVDFSTQPTSYTLSNYLWSWTPYSPWPRYA